MSDDVIDSPTGWVAKHIKRYLKSDGKDGHLYYGKPTLLLTTTGRRSGLPRRTALIYGRDGADYVVVASFGGSAEHPLWYTNLLAEPQVEVQVEAEVFAATARTATAEEKAALWGQMVGIHRDYDAYQAKTSREIPLVLLSRT